MARVTGQGHFGKLDGGSRRRSWRMRVLFPRGEGVDRHQASASWRKQQSPLVFRMVQIWTSTKLYQVSFQVWEGRALHCGRHQGVQKDQGLLDKEFMRWTSSSWDVIRTVVLQEEKWKLSGPTCQWLRKSRLQMLLGQWSVPGCGHHPQQFRLGLGQCAPQWYLPWLITGWAPSAVMSGMCNWRIHSYLWLMFLANPWYHNKDESLVEFEETVGLGIQLVCIF